MSGSMVKKVLSVNNITRRKSIFGKYQDDEYYFQLYIQTSFGKWTLESKYEYIVENNINDLAIFQKRICFC